MFFRTNAHENTKQEKSHIAVIIIAVLLHTDNSFDQNHSNCFNRLKNVTFLTRVKDGSLDDLIIIKMFQSFN